MKKLLVLALVCLSVVMGMVTVTAYAEEPLIRVGEEQLIQVGDYNDDVIALHQKMSELGLYSLRPESPWGPASVESLKVLQGVLGEEVTGVVSDQYDLNTLLAANIDINTNLATGTENPVTVAPVGSNNWCNPYELYPTSALGLQMLKTAKKFTVSFDWSATGVDTAVDAAISLRYTGADKTWYSAVGHFPIPAGDSSGHCEVSFEPNDDMREYGTGWLIGEIGTETNREIQIVISDFKFVRAE